MSTEVRSRGRLILLAWLCGLAGILYLDRICMSQAIVPIQKDLKLSNTDISYIMMAFSLAYGVFEIPSGRLGDRFGSRSVLTRIVLWWSLFTAATGLATGFISLLIVRFLFGVGEAGAFPNTARVIVRWFPRSEQGRVQGAMLAFAQLGAVIAPIGAAYLIEFIGWRWTFGCFGLIGVLWAMGFWIWFRDDPADHPQVNSAELDCIQAYSGPEPLEPGPVPWKKVFANRGILVLCSIMILGAFYTYFFYSWFSKYLSEARQIDNLEAGQYASIVLAGSALGMLLGGWLADRVTRRASDPFIAKRAIGVVSYLTAAFCLFLGIRCDNPMSLALLWGASFCAMHVTLPVWWSVAIPQSGRHVGSLCGLMNGIGVIGAMSSQWFVGAFSDWQAARGYAGRERWDPMFDVYVGVLVLGALAWWCYRDQPLEDPHSESSRFPKPS